MLSLCLDVFVGRINDLCVVVDGEKVLVGVVVGVIWVVDVTFDSNFVRTFQVGEYSFTKVLGIYPSEVV